MSGPSTILLAGLCVLCAPCIWDSDTIDDELRGLPEAFHLVSGRWYRHGEAYYRARIARLDQASEPSLDDLDDLAVAYERLGDRDRAIATMKRKARSLAAHGDEEHQYRYHANLGTFLAHSGRFDEAIVELEKAVAINPDAHFGRERFQIHAIRYLAAARKKPELWSEANFLSHAGFELGVHSPYQVAGSEPLDADAAYTAIAGMLRFGGVEGAELYRALGDQYWDQWHLNLAWWSWHRAIERGHPAAAAIRGRIAEVEEHWRQAAVFTSRRNPAPTLELYTEVRANAEAWLAEFQLLEADALERGEDPGDSVVLERILSAADERVPAIDVTPGWWATLGTRTRGLIAVWTLVVLLIGMVCWRWVRRRRLSAA